MYSCDQLEGLGSSAGKFGRLMGSLKCLFGWPFWRPGCLSWKFFIKCLGGVYMTKLHWPEFHTGMTFCYVYMMMGHFISRLFECTLHVDKIHVWIKSETLCMCYPLQTTCRPISHRNRWSFHVYMMPLWNFLPHSSTTTWMNSLRGGLQRHGICDSIMYTNVEPWREPEWTRAGAKVALVSCKHPLRVNPWKPDTK